MHIYRAHIGEILGTDVKILYFRMDFLPYSAFDPDLGT